MKKILSFIFALLLLSGAAFALDVSISPSAPTTTDDLSCLVNGAMDSTYVYEWSINGNYISSTNPLSQSLTNTGDLVDCLVLDPTIGTGLPVNIPVGIASVTILEAQVNTPPVLDTPELINLYGALGSQNLNLDELVTDMETVDSKIYWEISSDAGITTQLSPNRILTITTDGVIGTKYVTLTATDEGQLKATERIKIITHAKIDTQNHAPKVWILNPYENANFELNENIQFVILANDEDGDKLDLSIAFGDGNITNGDYPSLNLPIHSYDTLGEKNIGVKVVDEEGLAAYASVTINIIKSEVKTEDLVISNLETFEDNQFLSPSDTFYRGRGIYVKFNLVDSTTNLPYTTNQLATITMASEDSTGTFISTLTKFNGNINGQTIYNGFNAGTYYYQLNPISLSDQSLKINTITVLLQGEMESAEKKVEVLNNPPHFSSLPSTIIQLNEEITFNLDNYISDIEDADNQLTVSYVELSDPNLMDTSLVGKTLTIKGTQAGIGNLILNVTDTEGDFDTTVFRLRVHPKPFQTDLPPIAIIKAVITNGTINLDGSDSTDPDGEIVDYAWTVNGIALSDEEITSYDFLAEGEHIFTLTVTDNDGLQDSTGIVIDYTESGTNVPPVAILEYVLNNGSVDLDGSNSYDSDGTIESHEWAVNGVIVSSDEIINYAFPSNGEYIISLTVTDNEGATSTESITFNINNIGDNETDNSTNMEDNCGTWPNLNKLRIDNFAAIEPQEYYQAGQEIPVYLKFNNKGLEKQHVHVKFVMTDMNGILQNIQDVRVELNNIKIATTTIELPSQMEPGNHVIRAYVTDGSGIGQKTAHLLFYII